MLHEITEMSRIAPLFAGWDEKLVRSTLDGCMGRAWANESHTAAQIVNGDFAFYAGDPDAPGADELARHVPDGYHTPWLLCCSQHDRWNAAMERAWGEKARKIERYAIKKEPDAFDRERLSGFVSALPVGYELRRIDDALYAEARKADWSRDFVSQFKDAADYAARGLGMAVCKDGAMVAGASSYVVFRGGLEIEIQTLEPHRRKGLARACASALILACLDRGWHPSWDAAHRESVALAAQLGYHFDHPYATYSLKLDE